METVKLGKTGQVSIPRALMRQLGLNGEETLMIEVMPDGAIQLRPAAVIPLEHYSLERIESFEAQMQVSDKTQLKLKAALAAKTAPPLLNRQRRDKQRG